MAKPIRTPFEVRLYDNWAGYLYYFSICAIATTGINIFFDESFVQWFIISIISAILFYFISMEIAYKEASNREEQMNEDSIIEKSVPKPIDIINCKPNDFENAMHRYVCQDKSRTTTKK